MNHENERTKLEVKDTLSKYFYEEINEQICRYSHTAADVDDVDDDGDGMKLVVL